MDLDNVKSKVVKNWYSIVNIVDSCKKFILKPVHIYNRSRRRKIGQAAGEDGESDDESEDIVDKNLLKPTAVQLTKLYIQRQKTFKKSLSVPKDALLYYMNMLSQNEDELTDFKFIEELLSEDADVNSVDDMNENILFKAVKAEDESLVKILLKKGVNVKLVNKATLNVFHICARLKKAAIMRLIADKFPVNDLSEYLEMRTVREKQTPLHFAAKEGSIAIADCLISIYNVNKEALDYQNRTPLFVAAEFNRKSMVKLLIDLKCCISFTNEKKKEMLNNVKGQTALYWIVAKMPDIASDALNDLYEPNPYLRKDKHYLAALEPKVVKKKRGLKNTATTATSAEIDEFLPKSALSAVVETGNLDLIMHPTISALIEVKWKVFARKEAWIDFILSLTYVAVWIAFALWSPYNQRHKYDLNTNDDRFRLSLFIIGILFTFYFIISEIRQVYNDYVYDKKAIENRRKELDEYKGDSLDEDSAEAKFIKDEESVLKQFSNLTVFKEYFTDAWNIYDWVSILLLVCCIVTHIDDALNHSEEKARLHIRLMSITVIIISLRILKSSRIILPKLGTLVMILFYTMSDIAIWFLFHIVLWVSFSVSFWMIYGGLKFQHDVNEDSGCIDVYDTEYNEANNCTVVSVPAFEKGFGFLTYALYVITFGGNFDEPSMDAIDDQMKIPLTGAYIAFTILVSANIFIALLSATFQRVYDRAEANIIFERATAIIEVEKNMSYSERRHHIRYLRKIGYPYIDDSYNEIITTIDDRIVSLENDVKEQKDLLKGIENQLDTTSTSMGVQNGNAINLVRQLDEDVKELKGVIMTIVDLVKRPRTPQDKPVEESDNDSIFEKAPQFEYLKFDSAPSPSAND